MSDRSTPGREKMISIVLDAPESGDAVWVAEATRIVDALIEAAGGPDHIVRVRNRVMVVQHPIDERYSHELFDCRYLDLVQIAWSQGAFGEGYHRVWIDAGILMWEEVA